MRLIILSLVALFVVCSGCSSISSSSSEAKAKPIIHHDHTPHVGIMVPFVATDKSKGGFAELKLHDDKGDLELWLTKDQAGAQPFDLPLDSVIKVSFLDLKNEPAQLQVRNSTQNEDEDGQGNIRKSKTNYFIFPGDTGVDASFLMGKDFVAKVNISFVVNGVTYTTAPFQLYPHTH